MLKKFITLIFFLAICVSANAGEIFRFNYKPGQTYFIEGFVEEELYRNDIFIQTLKIKNTGELLVTEVKYGRAFHEGVYRYYTGDEIPGDYILADEYTSKFYRDIYGKYEIAEEYFMPVVRGVPTFPEKEVEIGDQWSSRAYEAHDFRQLYGILDPVILPAAVSYQYIGNTEIDGEKIAKIAINYVINYTFKYLNDTVSDIPLPFRVIGYFNQLFLWNLDKGLPHSYKENFDYVFIMSNGETVEYAGKANATLSVTEEPPTLYSAEQIRDRLRDTIPSVEVQKTDQGIVINIGEILFKFDSDELLESAAEDLVNIVEVLKEFPDRNVRVIGHTDSRGPEDYNLSLSLRRAKKTVAELKKILPALSGRATYMGMGENKPIADNETDEGRRKNRRVEIIILDP